MSLEKIKAADEVLVSQLELDCRNVEMMKLVENGVCCVYKALTPSIFSDVFGLSYKFVHGFAKLVII